MQKPTRDNTPGTVILPWAPLLAHKPEEGGWCSLFGRSVLLQRCFPRLGWAPSQLPALSQVLSNAGHHLRAIPSSSFAPCTSTNTAFIYFIIIQDASTPLWHRLCCLSLAPVEHTREILRPEEIIWSVKYSNSIQERCLRKEHENSHMESNTGPRSLHLLQGWSNIWWFVPIYDTFFFSVTKAQTAAQPYFGFLQALSLIVN